MRVFLIALLTAVSAFGASGKTEILWDTYGVPHIYAADRESMFYAHGWAQMRNQANLLLLLYGESRARGAEYWGPKHAELDRWLLTNNMPDRAKVWYRSQTPTFRKYMDAFARGINDFAKAHPESISPEYRCVLPVSGVDVVGHSLRVVYYMYMGSQLALKREVNRYLGKPVETAEDMEIRPGSNTWSVGPSRSASGKAMLLINPHLAWGETFYRYMEVHVNAPDYDLYGAPQIGFPVAVVGFNRQAGWGRTVNTIDTVDFYKLTLRNGQYLFDGKLRPFEHETKTFKIKQPDGSLLEEKLDVRSTLQGPVVYDQDGLTLAMCVAGLDRPKMLEQWFRMGEAQNLDQFKAALRMMSVPMWNANYADAGGHIMLVFDGLVPKRATGDWSYWSKVVPGDTSKTLWMDYHSFDELPKSIDPPSGFNQNTNEPPWTMTLPELNESKYPAYIAPPVSTPPTFRTLRSLQLLTESKSITYEQFVANKHSTRMALADAVLPDLLKAAESSTDANVLAAAALLKTWDRDANADSRGAVLFQLFTDHYFGLTGAIDPKLRVRWDPAHPLESSYGLADAVDALPALAAAAEDCKKQYGALNVAWGEVYRFRSGTADVPGNGAGGRVGVIRTIQYGKNEGNRHYAVHGETFVCAIEFGKPQQAQCALSYGNASQHGSPHLEDQLPLMVARKLHPVWRDPAEVKVHLELQETF
ncbi:MAG TPA: penicillin acylase family protein [Bryobacteraceae bacterium]